MVDRLKLNPAGIRDLLRSPGVKADLERRAQAIAASAGPGHLVDSETGHERVRASVRTGTLDTRRAEATGRNLTRAFDAGR